MYGAFGARLAGVLVNLRESADANAAQWMFGVFAAFAAVGAAVASYRSGRTGSAVFVGKVSQARHAVDPGHRAGRAPDTRSRDGEQHAAVGIVAEFGQCPAMLLQTCRSGPSTRGSALVGVQSRRPGQSRGEAIRQRSETSTMTKRRTSRGWLTSPGSLRRPCRSLRTLRSPAVVSPCTAPCRVMTGSGAEKADARDDLGGDPDGPPSTVPGLRTSELKRQRALLTIRSARTRFTMACAQPGVLPHLAPRPISAVNPNAMSSSTIWRRFVRGRRATPDRLPARSVCRHRNPPSWAG